MKLVFCPYKVLGPGTLCASGYPLKAGSFSKLESVIPALMDKPFEEFLKGNPWIVRCGAYYDSIRTCEAHSGNSVRIPAQVDHE